MNSRFLRRVLLLSNALAFLAGAKAARAQCAAPAPSIVAPASVLAGSSNLVATVKRNAGSSYAWTATNAAVYFGQGSHQVAFNAAGSGPIDLAVVETDASGCVASPATRRVEVKALPAWYDPAARVVPIVVSTAGVNDSFFTSQLTFTNRGASDAAVELTYTAAFGGGGGTGSVALPARRQAIFPDAIAFLRSIGVPIPPIGNRGGTLFVRFSGLSSPDAGSVTVRTTSSLAEGRAGLSYPGVAPAAALTGPSYLAGLRQDARDRTNVAFVNAGVPGADGAIVLRPTVFSGDPANPVRRTLPDVSLEAGGFTQLNEVLRSNGLELASGYLRVERVSGDAPYIAYAVTNNAATSDGSFIPAVPEDAFTATSQLVLPVAVETGGFVSELLLANLSPQAKKLRFAYSAEAIQHPSRSAPFTLELGPGEQRIVPSVLGLLREEGAIGVGPPGPTFAGPLFLQVLDADARGLFAGARTTTADGRFGLFYLAVSAGQAADGEAWIYGLEQSDTDRTNLALVNAGDVDATSDSFRIDLYDGATGALAASVEGVTLAARAWTQIGSVLGAYAPGVSNAYARIVRTGGFNSFLTYGVVNDGGSPGQRTGDGTFLAASPVLGRALAKMTTRLTAEARAEFLANPGALEENGITLTPAGAQLPTAVPEGFAVFAGSRRTQVSGQGTFAFDTLPGGTLLGELRRDDGLNRQTFPLAKLLAPGGQPPEPIDIPIIWDGPVGMSPEDPDLDFPPDAAPFGVRSFLPLGSVAPAPLADPLLLCVPKTGCSDVTAKCQRDAKTCCLDYDGVCADGHRYSGCALWAQQFIDSTCFSWVVRLCCNTESIFKLGYAGKSCHATHEGRICQSLDDSDAGFILSTKPIPDPPPGRYLPESISVACGQTVPLNLYNNTCGNRTDVEVAGDAGGSLDRDGLLDHFEPHGDNADLSIVHLKTLRLTYTAPRLLADGKSVAQDRVIARTDGKLRIVQLNVHCANQKVAQPVFYPGGGSYPAPAVSVTVTSATPGATIHITTDGSAPTPASPTIASGASITIDRTTRLQARAFRDLFETSDLAFADYTILPSVVENPVLRPAGGTFLDTGGSSLPVRVVVTGTTPGSVLNFTKNGRIPNASDAAIESGGELLLFLNETTADATIIRVRASKLGLTSSEVVTGTYVLKASRPVLSPDEGSTLEAVTVSMTTSVLGGVIRYTLDGSDPTESSPAYSAPIRIVKPTTVKARTFKPGEVKSDVVTATYSIQGPVIVAIQSSFNQMLHTTYWGVEALVNTSDGSGPIFGWELFYPGGPCGQVLSPGGTGSGNGWNHEGCVGDLEHRTKVKVTVRDNQNRRTSCTFCARKWEGQGVIPFERACIAETAACP